MKHPFQKVVLENEGKKLFAVAKNTIFVIDISEPNATAAQIWENKVDSNYKVKKQHEAKLKAIEEQTEKKVEQEQSGETGEPAKKIQKDNNATKIPKIPAPGPGAPPVYNYIRDIYLTSSQDYFVAVTDSDKSVLVFKNDDSFALQKRQEFPKRPCAITTSIDCTELVIGDKFGDVYRTPLNTTETLDPEQMEPILGHVSMLTSVLNVQSESGKEYVITTDRDEHIRISNYPKSYVIKKWLFNHNEFVSSVVSLPWTNSTVIVSGGGDDFLCSWKWDAEGNELLDTYMIGDEAEKYITDNHLAPKRFQNEQGDLREMCVSQILTVPQESKIIVFFDQISAFFVINVDNEGKFTLAQTVETSYNVVSGAVSANSSDLIISVDGAKDDALIVKYVYKDGKYAVSEDSEQLNKSIVEINNVEVESEKDIVPLFTISSLRKRSEH